MKQRYLVTLDAKVTQEFKKTIADLGLPVSVFSAILRDLLELMLPVYKEMAKKKKEGKADLSAVETSILLGSVINQMNSINQRELEFEE